MHSWDMKECLMVTSQGSIPVKDRNERRIELRIYHFPQRRNKELERKWMEKIFLDVTVLKEAGIDILVRNNLKEQTVSFQQLQAPKAV